MDPWAVATDSMFGTFSDTVMDMDFKNEVLFQGYWMQPQYEYGPPHYPSSNSYHDIFEDMKKFDENQSLDQYPALEQPFIEITASLLQTQGFLLEGGELGTKWRFGSVEEGLQEEASEEFAPARESSPEEISWTPSMMMEPENRGECFCVSWGRPKEEPEEEFKVETYWQKNGLDLYHEQDDADFGQPQQDCGISYDFEGDGSSCVTRARSLGILKPGEKRKTKPEKIVCLPVLRQHFTQSLKDAAKSMGVCPTTLKRICRQYGITRWPSRKIKKVNHSLRKLQLVVDSVEGADGLVQIGSLCSTFPELSYPKEPKPQPGAGFFTPKGPNSKLDSSSSSQNSGSIISCSTKTNLFATVNGLCTEGTSKLDEPASALKKTSEEAELQYLKQEEPLHLRIAQSHKKLADLQGLNILPPTSEDGGAFRVKVTFGESNIRFSLQPQWKFKDLQVEIAKRFSIEDFSGINLKYLDNDLESVLLTCDEDLEECKDLFKSSHSHTIKMQFQ